MQASGQLWDRKQHRIDYFGDVLLSGDDGAIVARAENLSEAGVFVTTEMPAQVGEEVVCELPLAQERLTLRGRVAWVRPATPAGMGIHFTEVDEAQAQTLREVVGPPRQRSLEVRVRFEGMPEPVRAEALPTSSGICLRTALPFLRLDSPVEFTFSEGEDESSQQGRLEEVTLYADWRRPVPRLQVHVSQEAAQAAIASASVDEAAETWVDAEPSPALRAAVEQAPPVDCPAEEVVEDEGERELGLDASGVAESSTEDEPSIEASSASELGLPSVLLDEIDNDQPGPSLAARLAASESMVIEALDEESEGGHGEPLLLERKEGEGEVERPTLRNVELTEQLLPACAEHRLETTLDELVQDLSERSQWDFEGVPEVSEVRFEDMAAASELERPDALPGMDPEDEDELFWQQSSPPKRRVALWVAALSMAAIAFTSAYMTGFFGVAGAKVSQWAGGAWALVAGDEAPKASRRPEAPKKASPTRRAVTPKVVTPKVVAKATTPKVLAKAATTPAWKATAAKADAPKADVPKADVPAPKKETTKLAAAPKRKTPIDLQVKGSATRLRLPIKGSLKGKRSYPLAQPHGVVVRLPYAKSAVRFGTYKLRQGALRTLWVKPHEDGVRFRVLYRKKARPACRLAITRKEVLLRCQSARKVALTLE